MTQVIRPKAPPALVRMIEQNRLEREAVDNATPVVTTDMWMFRSWIQTKVVPELVPIVVGSDVAMMNVKIYFNRIHDKYKRRQQS